MTLIPQLTLPPHPGPLTLRVPDVCGSYTIPYLQSARSVRLRLWEGHAPATVRLLRGERALGESRLAEGEVAEFVDLTPGEYTVEVCVPGEPLRRYERLGVGTVLAALGDSITEGYHSTWFWRDDLDLTAAAFPRDSVSHDGRNYPQYTPTTHQHRPEVNCFESWLTRLNDLLSERWQQPVFLANEGVGGITTGQYVEMMRNDAGWQERMALLRPTVWLVHLGVNDERAGVPAEAVRANLAALVDLLVEDWDARPANILLARPCYDYFPGVEPLLGSYLPVIDDLIAARGLGRGPDFFHFYAVDKAHWYGDDPVHPNVAGMAEMARLWAEALGARPPRPEG